MADHSRREFIRTAGLTMAAVAASTRARPAAAETAPAAQRISGAGSGVIRWHSTSQTRAWQTLGGASLVDSLPGMFDQSFEVKIDQPLQTMAGFGGAFTEKGWQALSALPGPARAAALDLLFKPGAGLDFTLCRTPIGANDIARGWYSYDETEGDFALEHFTIANDRETLIPYIRAARERQPALKVWASPWSPPTWMKSNRHYAMAWAWPGQPANGITEAQLGKEGADYFIQEDRYFDAYARYFRRYVDAYAKEGVPISMVMPQNEFNSAQPFPSCCWTPEGLARFIPFLGRSLEGSGAEIFLGTLERANPDLIDRVLRVPEAAAFIKGVGVQWAGRGALADIHRRHPNMAVWGSEQECGVGTNDWHYARYGWGVIKQYLQNGASAWQYWNLVMPEGGMSGWGWPQNSLITVETRSGRFTLNHEFQLLRHLSAYVQPGARYLPTQSYFGYENQLAFRNPDGTLVIVIQNEMSEALPVAMKIGDRYLKANLPADSFNSFRVQI